MKPSCCSSISRLLRTFLSISSMVFGGASGVSPSSIGASAGAERAASDSVGKRGSLPAASRGRLHFGRAAARRERSRCPGPQVGSGAAEAEAGGGRGGGGSPERGGGVALRGRAEPRAPWPAAEGAARRRPALLGQRPPHCAPRAASQRRGTDTSTRLPARPAKFEIYPLPPSLPRCQPQAAGGRRSRGDSSCPRALSAAPGGLSAPAGGSAPSPRPSPATFWVLLRHPWQRACALPHRRVGGKELSGEINPFP